MRQIRLFAISNALCYVIAFTISMLSQVRILVSMDMAEMAFKYDNLFTPAGITFSVWSIIYTALFTFIIYHLIKAFKDDEHHEANRAVNAIGWLFSANNLSTAAWVLFWLNDFLIPSAMLMLIQLMTLLLIQVRLDIFNKERSLKDMLFTQLPLSIYCGWICIATIANLSAVLVGYGWHGGPVSPFNWTIVMISIAALITIYMILARKNIFFGLIVIWALYGIILKRTAVDKVAYETIIYTAWVAISLIVLAAFSQLIRALTSKTAAISQA